MPKVNTCKCAAPVRIARNVKGGLEKNNGMTYIRGTSPIRRFRWITTCTKCDAVKAYEEARVRA